MAEVFVADGSKVVIAGRRQFSKRTSNAIRKSIVEMRAVTAQIPAGDFE
jgi:hypothetical protein